MSSIRVIAVVIIAFFLHSSIEAQTGSSVFVQKDSLLSKSYDDLIQNMNSYTEMEVRFIYIRAIIQKAKNDKNWEKLVLGYNIGALLSPIEQQPIYGDSIIALQDVYQDKYNPTEAYIIKGNYYYKKRIFKKSLDNYLAAHSFAQLNTNENLQFRTNYSIAILKDRINLNDEAQSLHRSNYTYAKRNIKAVGESNYLSTLFALSNGFRKLEKLDSAVFYNNIGLAESFRLNNDRKYNFFRMNSGIIAYEDEKFYVAKDSLHKSITHWNKIDDAPNLAVNYYFLGKTQIETDSLQRAIKLFQKIDSIFTSTNDILPELRDSYTILIDYYNSERDFENELLYVKRLLSVDSILRSNHQYLNTNIRDKYDVPILIAKREEIIERLEKGKKRISLILNIVITLLGFVVVLAVIQTYRRKRLYKIYTKLISPDFEVPEIIDTELLSTNNNTTDISEETSIEIIEGLNQFEHTLGFLDKNLTLSKLSDKLNTNTSYLSKIINTKKNQSFTTYLKNLRIKYAFESLKTNDKLEKYTIKAIAEEFGFKSAESFSKAFLEVYNMYPSYFIKQLKNSRKTPAKTSIKS